MQELVTAFQDWERRRDAFLTEAETLLREMRLLTGHPGWPEFVQMVETGLSLIYVEGSEAGRAKAETILQRWETRWQTSGQVIVDKLVVLTRRSEALESKQRQLWEEWNALARRRRAVVQQLTAAQRLDTTMADMLLQRMTEEDAIASATLHAYTRGPLGLWQQTGR
jgi:hypothetical protein